MSIKEKIALLDIDKFVTLVENNTFFNVIASNFLDRNLSKEIAK